MGGWGVEGRPVCRHWGAAGPGVPLRVAAARGRVHASQAPRSQMLLSSLLMDEEAKAQRRKGIQDSGLFLQPCGDLIRPMLVVHKHVHKRVLSSALGGASSQAWGNHR